jgi:hypothetical protein
LDANLYRLSKTSPFQKITNLPNNGGADWVAAQGSTVVVSDSRTGVDGIDLVGPGGLKRVVTGRAFTPALSRSGNMAYAFPVFTPDPTHRSDLPKAWEIATVAVLKSSTPVVWYSTLQPLGSPTWSPSGRLIAFLENLGAHATVWVTNGHGARQLVAVSPGATALMWSPKGQELVASGWRYDTELINVVTGKTVSLASGWWAMAWSAHGRALLMVRGSTLGVLYLNAPQTVKVIGHVTGGSILMAAWVGSSS